MVNLPAFAVVMIFLISERHQRLDALPVRYGEPLSPQARAAFVDQAPDERKEYVATEVGCVRF